MAEGPASRSRRRLVRYMQISGRRYYLGGGGAWLGQGRGGCYCGRAVWVCGRAVGVCVVVLCFFLRPWASRDASLLNMIAWWLVVGFPVLIGSWKCCPVQCCNVNNCMWSCMSFEVAKSYQISLLKLR